MRAPSSPRPAPLRRVLALLGAASALLGCSSAGEGRRPPAATGSAAAPAPPEALTSAEPEDAPGEASDVFVEPFFPFLEGEDTGASVSVGDTSHGYVVNAKPVEESESLAILPKQKARDLRYGTDELRALLAHAGRELFDKTKTKLWIGNVGRRGGGDIEYSVSHNCGRDADVALLYRRGKEPVDPPDLVPLNGLGKNVALGLELDVERTWVAVRSMLLFPKAQVQFIFVSEPIKRLLLAHARAKKEPADLVRRAIEILRQPSASHPHNDHLHVRLFCARRDVEGGCVDSGHVHPFARPETAAREKKAVAVAFRLVAPSAEERRRAVLRLALLGAGEHAGRIAERLADEDAGVRVAAASALGALEASSQAEALMARFSVEEDAGVRVAIARALPELGGPAVGTFLRDELARALAASPAPSGEAVFAAVALAPGPEIPGPPSLFPWVTPLLSSDFGEAPRSELPPSAFPSPAVAELAGEAELPRVPLAPGAPLALGPRDVTLALLRAAGRSERPEPLEPLLGFIRHPEPDLRLTSCEAASFLSARRVPPRLADPALAASEVKPLASAFERALAPIRRLPQPAWVTSALVASGYSVPRVDRRHLYELVRAVAGPEHVSYNAQRMLVRLTEHRPAPMRALTEPAWNKHEACRYWFRYVAIRRRMLGLPAPPKTLPASCG